MRRIPATSRRISKLPGGDAKGFAQRRFFGSYLKGLLTEALASGLVEIEHRPAVAAEREANGWTVKLDGGADIHAAALALANGNQEPEPLRGLETAGPRYLNNPWGAAARAAVAGLARTGGSAMLIGTGLTMVDLALSLDAAGHRGRVVALSRRGQIPRAHADVQAAPVAIGGRAEAIARASSLASQALRRCWLARGDR